MKNILNVLEDFIIKKSQVLCKEIENNISNIKKINLFESSLTVEIETNIDVPSEKICRFAYLEGIKIIPSLKKGAIRLCFAGIKNEDISKSLKALNNVLQKI